MPPPSPPRLDHQHWTPATFQERGVAVPFTCPMLAGARVRLIDRRRDLVVPHPGGARGVYILALASMAEYCAPTLHDMRLAAALTAAPHLTPASIRAAARGVAAEGAAGRAAAAAASAAIAADAARATTFEGLLLGALAREVDQPPACADATQRTRHALHRLAGRNGRSPEAVLADISVLARHLVEAGLDLEAGPHGGVLPGRCRTLLSVMAATAGQMRSAGAAGQPAVAHLEAAMTAMHAAGRLVLDAAQQPLHRLDTLLDDWSATPQDFVTRIERADWLLDGWETICSLWNLAQQDGMQDAAVAEAARLLPPIPAEAEPWLAGLPGLHAGLQACCAAAPLQRARAALPAPGLTQIARNERIRAAAV